MVFKVLSLKLLLLWFVKCLYGCENELLELRTQCLDIQILQLKFAVQFVNQS